MLVTKEKPVKKNLSKSQFQKELREVKEKLPSHYGVIMKSLYPKINLRKVYNVVNMGIHNEDILFKLKFIIPSDN